MAKRPRHIPARGWKDVLWRTYDGVNENNLFLLAGGVTYYVLLALFPGLVALVSFYGLAFDRAQVTQQVSAMSGMLPGAAQQLIETELKQIVTSSGKALSLGAVIGLLFALYSASRGMSGLMTALSAAYGQEETRSFVRFNLTAFGLTLAILGVGLVAIILVAVLPALVSASVFSSAFFKWALLILEWPVLMVVLITALGLLYRLAPDRNPPKWKWITPGAIIATVLWVIGSILFSAYVANFNNYNATYGSLGALVILLTWLYLTSFVVLLGAQINAELERQTRADTTVGPPKPMGDRGAFAADTLGKFSDSS
ncbi:MAG: YihY/virulence factor BrkB family protein [Pseudomonadota bacterium]|nr:YihY/virulence factor BrkB family protein [Pseudomonadota bacterium]